MKEKHEGPSILRTGKDKQMKRLNSFVQLAKGTPIKPRKVRGLDQGPRDFEEARFRKEEVLPYLRKLKRQGKVLFYRVENGLPGYKGISDFMIFSFVTNCFIFCELKSLTGIQSEEQKDFEKACRACGIRYILARKLNHVKMWVEKL